VILPPLVFPKLVLCLGVRLKAYPIFIYPIILGFLIITFAVNKHLVILGHTKGTLCPIPSLSWGILVGAMIE
jgi:hypothetical protein